MAKEVPYSLLAKYFSGNCNKQEKLQAEEWKTTDRANEQIFREYERIWKQAQTEKVRFSPDIDKALNKVNQKLDIHDTQIVQKSRVIEWMYYTRRIAAVLIVAAGIWLTYKMFHQKPVIDQLVEVATLQGEKKDVLLPDGSHVWLNSASKLTYAAKFEGKERKINLEGEAYFEVAKDPSKPFIIDAGNAITTVLGTAFNLRARKEESFVTVTVTEGKVALAGKDPLTGNALKLKVGDKGILNIAKKQLVQEENNDPNFLAWKTGKLVFRNTPLNQVVATLTDFYGTNIRLEDDSKGSIPFTSTFDHQTLRDVITIMEMSLGLKADTTDRGIVLK